MDNHKKCSFCGREYDEKFKGTIVKGPDNIYICEKCVERCSEMIEEEAARKRAAMPAPKIKTPSEIKKYLDEYVVGQEQAKKILSVAVYNHMKMLEYYDKNSDPDIEIEKNNVIMVGPSGTGKTYMIKTIAKLFDVPYAICDATGLTASGLTTL